MHDDSCKIVSGRELRLLHRRCRLWYLGWCVSAVLTLVLIWTLAGLRAYRQTLAEIQQIKAEVIAAQADQRALTSSYTKAWENQQATGEALMTWWSYCQERRGIVESNRGMVSSRSPGRQ